MVSYRFHPNSNKVVIQTQNTRLRGNKNGIKSSHGHDTNNILKLHSIVQNQSSFTEEITLHLNFKCKELFIEPYKKKQMTG